MSECKHNYVLERITQKRVLSRFSTTYHQYKVYFCSQCLDEVTKHKSEYDKSDPPNWWDNNVSITTIDQIN